MRQRLYSGLSDDFASENRWKTFKGKPEPEIHVFYHGFYHGFYLKYRGFLWFFQLYVSTKNTLWIECMKSHNKQL